MTFEALSAAHCAIRLRNGGWRTRQKLAVVYLYVIELLALCYCLCWFWLVGQAPTRNNTQTKYMQLAKRLWVRVQVQPTFF